MQICTVFQRRKSSSICDLNYGKSYWILITFTYKLEYLAVYCRASMAAFHQLSTHIVPPRSNVREAWQNTHSQKFDPESLYQPS